MAFLFPEEEVREFAPVALNPSASIFIIDIEDSFGESSLEISGRYRESRSAKDYLARCGFYTESSLLIFLAASWSSSPVLVNFFGYVANGG